MHSERWLGPRTKMGYHKYPVCSFTLIELLVVVAIIAVLVAILLPALASARAQARVALCSTNMHQIGLGVGMYANDNQNEWPRYMYYSSAPAQRDAGGWTTNVMWMLDRLPPGWTLSAWHWEALGRLMGPVNYVRDPKLFFCPSDSLNLGYLKSCKWDGTESAVNIFASYCLRGYAQGYATMGGNPGTEGKKLDSATDRSLISCFFMYYPGAGRTADNWLIYHKSKYPVWFSSGDVQIINKPIYIDLTSMTFSGSVMNIWNLTWQQYYMWNWFDENGR